MDTFDADIRNLQPSQLYICAEKLAEVERLTAEGDGTPVSPVPVKRLESRIVLTDGHTRAVAAFRRGRTSVPAYWETDLLDWEAYEICVQWCTQEGIHSVADLGQRIVPTKQYEELWYKRCRALHQELAARRRTEPGATRTADPRVPEPLDYDTDPGRMRAGREVIRRYSPVGDVHTPVADRICAEKLSPVLDVGCGEGSLLAPLRSRGVEAVGLDSSPTMLASVAEPKVLADARSIPFQDGRFGAVAALYMLYHFADPREVLAESHRVLRAGGLFAACAPSQHDNPELAELLPKRPPGTFDSEIGPEMIREFFQDVEVQRWDAPLLPLPNAEALLLWLRHQGLSDTQAHHVASQVSTPLMLTKRGALIFGYKRA